MFNVERQQYSLKSELLEVRDRETALRGLHSALQDRVEQLREELTRCRDELERGRLELSQTTLMNQTLQRKHKVT